MRQGMLWPARSCMISRPVETDIEVGSIIFAPGVEEFQASLWEELGYGRFANVLIQHAVRAHAGGDGADRRQPAATF